MGFDSYGSSSSAHWKYEGFTVSKTQRSDDEHETVGCLKRDEAWRTCSKIGSSFSIYGCFYCCNEVDDDRVDFAGVDSERGSCVAPTFEENVDLSNIPINLPSQEEPCDRESAGF